MQTYIFDCEPILHSRQFFTLHMCTQHAQRLALPSVEVQQDSHSFVSRQLRFLNDALHSTPTHFLCQIEHFVLQLSQQTRQSDFKKIFSTMHFCWWFAMTCLRRSRQPGPIKLKLTTPKENVIFHVWQRLSRVCNTTWLTYHWVINT